MSFVDELDNMPDDEEYVERFYLRQFYKHHMVSKLDVERVLTQWLKDCDEERFTVPFAPAAARYLNFALFALRQVVQNSELPTLYPNRYGHVSYYEIVPHVHGLYLYKVTYRELAYADDEGTELTEIDDETGERKPHTRKVLYYAPVQLITLSDWAKMNQVKHSTARLWAASGRIWTENTGTVNNMTSPFQVNPNALYDSNITLRFICNRECRIPDGISSDIPCSTDDTTTVWPETNNKYESQIIHKDDETNRYEITSAVHKDGNRRKHIKQLLNNRNLRLADPIVELLKMPELMPLRRNTVSSYIPEFNIPLKVDVAIDRKDPVTNIKLDIRATDYDRGSSVIEGFITRTEEMKPNKSTGNLDPDDIVAVEEVRQAANTNDCVQIENMRVLFIKHIDYDDVSVGHVHELLQRLSQIIHNAGFKQIHLIVIADPNAQKSVISTSGFETIPSERDDMDLIYYAYAN